jgi:MoaA/NifB/PqqE/SkfB family radical SAM enzyme
VQPSDLWRVTLDTNPDDCNLRCVMCEEHSRLRPEPRTGAHRRMPFPLARRAIEQAIPLGLREVIPSTMGEPLLWDGIDALVALCRSRGLLLNLTTNGTWPSRGPRAWAALLVPVTSDIKVSMNGATAATQEAIMAGSRLKAVASGLRELVAVRGAHAAAGGHRCRITVQVTFMEANVRELPDLVALAAELGADRVQGHQLWAHWPALAAESLRRSPDSVARWNETVSRAREIARVRGIQLDGFVPLDPASPEDAHPEAKCPFLGREAWIATDGRFSPCCAPDEERRSLGKFGSIRERSLAEIWGSPEYQALVDGHRDHPLCGRCTMRRSTP